MHSHAEIISLGHAAGTVPRRERIEVSIIAPFCDEESVLPHCLERCSGSASGWPSLASSCSSMTETATAAPNTWRGKP
jgi:hypothetical protein